MTAATAERNPVREDPFCLMCGGPCSERAWVCIGCRPVQQAARNRADRAEHVAEAARLVRLPGWTSQRVAYRLRVSARTVDRYLAEARRRDVRP